jgi:arylsulfatase A-like enzyme
VKGKAFPFDVDTKVPFLVRGPGIRRSLKSELVANIDIAPTFLHIAGLQVGHFKTSVSPVFRIRIRIGSGFNQVSDPDLDSESGSTRAKKTKSRKNGETSCFEILDVLF